jgi:hypothetical protein
MTTARFAASVIGAACALGLAAPAGADVVERGYVVWIEAGEAFFDAGAPPGAAGGNSGPINRPRPRTQPNDRTNGDDDFDPFALEVAQVRGSLSMARLSGAAAAEVAVGDIVEVLIADRDPAPGAIVPTAAPALAPAHETLPEVDAETAAVLAVWASTAGTRVDVRIAAWERFLKEHPQSPYTGALRQHLALLHEYRDDFPPPAALVEPLVGGVVHDAPRRARFHQSMPLAFALERPDDIVAAWIHYRVRGSDAYRRADLRTDGDGYLRASLPAADVVAPGVEYFVEAATREGAVGSAIGTPTAPMEVVVEPPPSPELFVERRNRSRMSIQTTYLDFATFDHRDCPDGAEPDCRRDRYFLFEADFFLRLYRRLYGIRSGFGVINGFGGYADGTEPRGAGFNYGYTEVELRATSSLSLLTRLIAGLGQEGLGFGAEGRLRFGPEDATNLSFAASSLEEIGFLSEIHMQWASVPHVPMGFGVAVTDRPNRADLGVRLSVDIGWRALSWFQPTVRLSYQGRTVEHSGLGVGLGMVFDW